MLYKIKTAARLLLKKQFKLVGLLFKARYKSLSIRINGLRIKAPDALSFVFMYDEIWLRRIYEIQNINDRPYIVDAGANIGLSVLFFKRQYPNADIIAFEPDPTIHAYLLENLKNNGVQNTRVIQKALWNSETELSFHSEGADGGYLSEAASNGVAVRTERLSVYLNRVVDLLKIDIEGAEHTVLEEIEHCLGYVKQIFVEYHSFKNQQQNLSHILKILHKNNFRVYIENGGIKTQSPFLGLNSMNNMDIQLNIWGWKEV